MHSPDAIKAIADLLHHLRPPARVTGRLVLSSTAGTTVSNVAITVPTMPASPVPLSPTSLSFVASSALNHRLDPRLHHLILHQ